MRQHIALGVGLVLLTGLVLHAETPPPQNQAPALPSGPMNYGMLSATFAADGTFTLGGGGWPNLEGTWKAAAGEVELALTTPERGCGEPGRFRYQVDGREVRFALVADPCMPRRMMLMDSVWLPAGETPAIPPRNIVRTGPAEAPALAPAAPAAGNWPSFRGPHASGIADGLSLADTWDGTTGDGIIWRAPIEGLAHSSPVVWGDTIFVATAVGSRGNASFRPGLYGDGDASDDRTSQQWKVIAIDRLSGQVRWERVAAEGAPLDKRHIKSTYASATPATNGQIVVATFGSMGAHAFDMAGNVLWKVDYGRVNLGAYDLPSFEWGPASSPIIWNDLVILQVDTHADSFLLALRATTGETVWKTDREEIPSWGTPTVAETPAGPVLVTNASNFIRGYDPRTGKELWRIGRSSKISAPTPIFADGLWVIASGRAPERPIFVVRPDAAGDLTLADDAESNAGIAWSKTARGPYMPTPLAYRGQLYVLANNGIFDAYDLQTGKEIYRQRLPNVGSGFSASPVAAEGKIYLSSEDGEILVIGAGPEFSHIATNTMGDTIMATPALSGGVMYVRTARTLFAVGARR
jgi:outer membrane protein assembly factor BamB